MVGNCEVRVPNHCGRSVKCTSTSAQSGEDGGVDGSGDRSGNKGGGGNDDEKGGGGENGSPWDSQGNRIGCRFSFSIPFRV